MRTKGVDIFRSKGILAVLGTDERYVFQVAQACCARSFKFPRLLVAASDVATVVARHGDAIVAPVGGLR
jgi:hypothetical protein